MTSLLNCFLFFSVFIYTFDFDFGDNSESDIFKKAYSYILIERIRKSYKPLEILVYAHIDYKFKESGSQKCYQQLLYIPI